MDAATLIAQDLLPWIDPYLIPSFYLRKTVTFTRPRTIAPNLNVGAWNLKGKVHSSREHGFVAVVVSLGGVSGPLVDVLLR